MAKGSLSAGGDFPLQGLMPLQGNVSLSLEIGCGMSAR